jgi:hypothetical protein
MLIDATETEAAAMVLVRVDAELGRLRREDSHLHHLTTHAVELADRPKTPSDRRGHAISRVLYTWLRLEETDPEAVAQDIETLAALGRSEKWKAAVRTWAHIARTDPVMFHQFGTYTNFAA